MVKLHYYTRLLLKSNVFSLFLSLNLWSGRAFQLRGVAEHNKSIRLMFWPVHSLDLNLIVNVWFHIKVKLNGIHISTVLSHHH